MVKIRVYYDDDRELAEMIKLLSPRLNYCKIYAEDKPQRAYLGIKTDDLLADFVNEIAEEAAKTEDSLGGIPPIREGGEDQEIWDSKMS